MPSKTLGFDLGGVLGLSVALLDAIPDPFFIKGPDSVYLWANRSWTDLMGLDPDRIVGSTDSALFPPELGLSHSEPDRRVLSSGEMAQKVIFIDTPGCPRKHIQLTASPIVAPDRKVAGIFGAARDVTERLETTRPKEDGDRYQETMSLCTRSLLMSRTSEVAIAGFLRHLGEINKVHSVSIFENFTTPEGELWFRRRYIWAQSGSRREDPGPQSMPYGPWLVRWHDMLSMGLPVQGTVKTLPPEESAVLAEEEIESVLLLPLDVDRQFWGFIRLAHCSVPHRWEDGELRVLSVAAESLSAFLMRMRSEEALRRKIEEQEALWAGTPDFLYIKDKHSVYLAANPAFAELLGVPCEAIPGRTDFDFFPVKVASKIRGEDRTIIESATTLSDIEDTLASAAGRTIQAITTKAPLRDSTGAVVGIIGITRDMTERVELERQVRQAQKMESIGTLAAGIAHDFNNLLTAILGFAHLVLPKLNEKDPLHRYVDRIAGAGTRAKDLVRQLLTFSRQVETERRPILLGPIVKESIKFLRSTLPAHIEIISAFPDALPYIEADATQMHQVVMNLCVNAAHAMPEGGTLTVRLDTVELDEAPQPESGEPGARQWVRLTIEDTGCGMDEATKARIFEPFFTTKEAGKGTGLGLSTVYGIVEDSSGTIEVDSTPGEGTVFRLRFPATDAAARYKEEPATQLSQRGSETVLFVDDEPAVLELGQAALEEAGYTVLTASDGAEALSIYERHLDEIALLITDTTMPRMSGPQLARHVLRALRPDAKIILCSGQAVRDDDRRALDEAGGAILPKPFIPTEILATVRRVLDG